MIEKPAPRQSDHWLVHVCDATTTDQINKRFSGPRIPRITDCIIVSSKKKGEHYRIEVRHVNEQFQLRRSYPCLVKFSERKYAPYNAPELQLCTPRYYRKYECIQRGIYDPLEGAQQSDWSRLIHKHMFGFYPTLGNSSIKATATHVAESEPWLFCTSICPDSERILEKLRREFSSSCCDKNSEYDAVTEVGDAGAFARQLGIDFATGVDHAKYIKPDSMSRSIEILKQFDRKETESTEKVITVYHGPVIYREPQIVEYPSKDFQNSVNIYKLWFSKHLSFSNQTEYRFAISMLGKPREDTCYIPISDDLRRLTTPKAYECRSVYR